jgi:hypothetical protein
MINTILVNGSYSLARQMSHQLVNMHDIMALYLLYFSDVIKSQLSMSKEVSEKNSIS